MSVLQTNKIDCKNIGFFNCEWNYRWILSSKDNCLVSGDGITIENKLYILNEVSFYQHIKKLEIQIKAKIKSKKQKNIAELNLKTKTNKFAISNSDLDSIELESVKSKNSILVNSKIETKDFNNSNIITTINNKTINYMESENNALSGSYQKNTNKDLKKNPFSLIQ